MNATVMALKVTAISSLTLERRPKNQTFRQFPSRSRPTSDIHLLQDVSPLLPSLLSPVFFSVSPFP